MLNKLQKHTVTQSTSTLMSHMKIALEMPFMTLKILVVVVLPIIPHTVSVKILDTNQQFLVKIIDQQKKVELL